MMSADRHCCCVFGCFKHQNRVVWLHHVQEEAGISASSELRDSHLNNLDL